MLGGCGSSPSPSGAGRTSTTGPSATSTPAATSAPSATTTTTTTVAPTTTAAPSTTAVVAPPGTCPTAVLAPSLGSANGYAGGTGYVLTLRNTGSRACTLLGYPGVSLVAGDQGNQVGAAAVRDPGATPSVVLAPGKAAEAVVLVADAGNFPASCRPVQARGLRVYPPGDFLSLYLPDALRTCANPADRTLQVGPVQAGPISA